MSKVNFTYKSGKTRFMTSREADILQKLGHGYLTRDMATAPAAQSVPVVQKGRDLDSMDRDELHALARELGVKVHHASGADKVRAAIAESGK